MFPSVHSQSLRVAIAGESLAIQLSRLLERQRAEEPETPITLAEVTLEELVAGMTNGRFDAALTLTPMKEDSFRSEALWQDELAVAVPVRSPLLVHPRIPREELVEYPLVMWHPSVGESVNRLVHDLLDDLQTTPFEAVQHVCSFGLMVALVSAGYGIGIGSRSRIASSRSMNIVMRPIAGPPRWLTTYLVCRDGPRSQRLHRFAGRAAAIQ